MAINLSKSNISLDQFQKMASGDFNAGEVALKSETKLTKINNHVHAISWNTKSISHEEIMAIKNAFVNALESNGVSDKEKINGIRRELGLAHGAGTAKRNSGIVGSFTEAAEKIPFEFRKMAIEVREEATAIFGKESVKQEDRDIGLLARFRDYTDFGKQMTKAGQDITPENMRDHFRTACLRKSAENFIGEAIKNAMDGAGIAVENENYVGNAVKKLHPGLVDRLAAATNADEANRIVDGIKADIVSVAVKCSTCDEAKAKLNGFIQEAFAKEMGVEWKIGDKVLVNASKRADSKGNDLVTDILAGKVAASDKAAIEAEFKALAAKIAHERAEKLRQVHDLKLPADSELLVKHFLANHNDPRKLNVGRAFELSRGVDVKGVTDAFKMNAPKEKIYQELGKISKSADGKIFELFADEKEVGGEESMLGAPVMLFMALGKESGLATQLAKFFERPDVQADRQNVGEKMPMEIASLCDYVNN